MTNLPAKIDNTISVCPHPLRAERQDVVVPMGLSVEQMVRYAQPDPRLRPHAHVHVNGYYIEPDRWGQVVPVVGDAVEIRMVPRGGGGGGGKDPMKTIMTVAVVATAAVASAGVGGLIASGTWMGGMSGAGALAYAGAAAAGAAVSIAGRMAINAIAPPPGQNMPEPGGSGIEEKPTYSIESARNRARLYQPIRKLIGTHRIVPDKAAKEYTEIAGDNTYLRMVFCWAYGPLQIDDVRIGETPISQFDEVEIEHRQGYSDDSPLTLYPNTVNEQALQVLLQESDGWSTRRSSTDADELSVDITFPQGLVEFDDKGNRNSRTVEVEIEYTEVGGTYSNVHTFSVTQSTTSRISRNHRWTVSRGQYDVRVRRITSDTDDVQIKDKVYWTTLRSFTNEDPVKRDDVALTVIRIKATDQLNGIISELNGVCTSILPTWDSSSETWVEQATNNPAAGVRTLLQGNGNASPLPDSRVDITGLQDFSEYCADEGWTCNLVIESRESVRKQMQDVCSTARAAPSLVDGVWGVVVDKERTKIAQHVTPRNSWGYQGSKEFAEIPHAFKVRFTDETSGYRQNTRIVYDDGYDESNATDFEELQLPGVTSPDLAWRHGRRHLAQAKLRPETHSFKMDPEHLVANRGDLIKFAHTVPLFGIKSARVKSVTDTDSDGDVEQVTLDDICPMESGKSYFIRFRHPDGSSSLHEVDTDPGEQNTLTFVTPIADTDAPDDGDLAMFGESDLESVDLIIKSIEPTNDLNAKIAAVDAAPAVHTADSGEIPAFDPQITEPVFLDPPKPNVTNVRSNEEVLYRDTDGSLAPRILIDFTFPSGLENVLEAIEVQFKEPSEESWTKLPRLDPTARSASFKDVEQGAEYDLRLRTVHREGAVSAWATVSAHTVVGKSTPPPAVQNLGLKGDRLHWDYPDPPRDFAGFRVKHIAGRNQNWLKASDVSPGLIEPPIDISDFGDGIRTILVRGEDTAGNQSETQWITINFGDPDIANVIATTNFDPDWSGTLTNGTVVDGNLEAATDDSYWTGEGENRIWTGDNGYLWWSPQYKEMFYTAQYTPLEAAELSIQLDLLAKNGWLLEIRKALGSMWWEGNDNREAWAGQDSSETWSGQSGQWLGWPGKMDVTVQEYDLQLTTFEGTSLSKVKSMTANLDVPDIVESLQDVSIDSSGTRLPINKDYRSIKSVNMALQESGNAAILRIGDKDTTGPLIYAYDDSFNSVSATIDAEVYGY